MKNGISVIICCYNSEKRIPGVLNHLEQQKNTDGFTWEVILVDNASTDNTAAVAEKTWSRKDVDLRIIPEPNPGHTNARRKGLAEAKYDIIVFVDDDNLLSDIYITTAHQIMQEHPDVGIAGGLGTAVSTVPLPSWFAPHFSAFAVGAQAEEEGYVPRKRTYLHGAGVVLRKEGWDLLIKNGFKSFLGGRTGKSLGSGDDSEISYAYQLAGYKLWYSPSLEFTHVIDESRLDWNYLKRLIKAFGRSRVRLEPYHVFLFYEDGWKKSIRSSWLFGMTVSMVELLRKTPGYLQVKLSGTTGSRKETLFIFRLGMVQEWFAIFGQYSKIKENLVPYATQNHGA